MCITCACILAISLPTSEGLILLLSTLVEVPGLFDLLGPFTTKLESHGILFHYIGNQICFWGIAPLSKTKLRLQERASFWWEQYSTSCGEQLWGRWVSPTKILAFNPCCSSLSLVTQSSYLPARPLHKGPPRSCAAVAVRSVRSCL